MLAFTREQYYAINYESKLFFEQTHESLVFLFVSNLEKNYLFIDYFRGQFKDNFWDSFEVNFVNNFGDTFMGKFRDTFLDNLSDNFVDNFVDNFSGYWSAICRQLTLIKVFPQCQIELTSANIVFMFQFHYFPGI